MVSALSNSEARREQPPITTAGDASAAAPDPRRAMRRRLVVIVKLSVGAGLVAWLIYSGQLDLARLARMRLSTPTVAVVVLLLGSMVLPGLRWWLLLRVPRLDEPLDSALRLTWVAYFWALVLPGAAGGDVAKGYLILRSNPEARARALSTVLLDRLLGIYSLLVLGGISVGWLMHKGNMPSLNSMAVTMLSIFAGATIVATALAFPLSRRALLGFLPHSWRVAWNESIELYVRGRATLGACFLLSLVSNGMSLAAFSASGEMLGEAVSLEAAFSAGALVVLANCLPLSPGGIGVAEVTSETLFAAFGVTCGAEMMALVRVCLVGLALPGGLLLIKLPKKRTACGTPVKEGL